MVVWIPDSLQCVGLANINGCDVGITEAESLLQVWVPFKKILVSSNLQAEVKKENPFLMSMLHSMLILTVKKFQKELTGNVVEESIHW